MHLGFICLQCSSTPGLSYFYCVPSFAFLLFYSFNSAYKKLEGELEQERKEKEKLEKEVKQREEDFKQLEKVSTS